MTGQRRSVALFALAYFLVYASVGLQVPFLSPALLSLGFSAAVVGSLWAVRSTLAIVAPLFWGALADRAGSGRPFAALTMASGAAALWWLAVAESELEAFLAFALYGIAASATAPLVDGLVLTALGDEKHRFGAVRSFGSLGFGVAALLGNFLVHAGVLVVDARSVLPLAGALHLAGALAVVFSERLPRPRAESFVVLARAVKDSGLWWLAVVGTLHGASHGAYTAFITPLASARGLGALEVGVSLTVAIVAEVAVMRWSQSALRRFSPERLITLTLVVTAARWGMLVVADGALSFVLLHALHGISFGLFYTTAVTLVAYRTPDVVAQGAQGFFSSLQLGLGGAVGMGLSGALLEGGYGAPVVWGAMAALSTTALLVVVVRQLTARGPRSRRAA